MEITGGALAGSMKIAEYFGLIEGVSTQVTRLVHQAFISAKKNLEDAQYATGQEQVNYVRRAKDRFIDAIAVEKNENLVLAYVGLSMCQYFLGDYTNARRNLSNIAGIQLTLAEQVKAGVKRGLLGDNGPIPIFVPNSGVRGAIGMYNRGLEFEKFKQDAQDFCNVF